MSKSEAKISSGNGHGLLDRARGVVVVAVPAGQRASDNVADAMKKGVLNARGWTAPQMESFASVVEGKITPAVTSSLRSGAKKVQPPRESRMRGMSRSVLSWRGLMVMFAVLGIASAAAGMVMRKRYSSATSEAETSASDTTTTVVPEPAAERATPNPNDYRIGSNW